MPYVLTDYPPENGLWTDSFAKITARIKAQNGGTLTVPAGVYPTGPIELCAGMTLELQAGARVVFTDDMSAYPVADGKAKPCINVYNADHVTLCGAGTFDGSGAAWWREFRAGQLDCKRPFLFHAQDCQDLTVQGITFCNSPLWTVHPLRCRDVKIMGVTVRNPYDSPNTDGINPESCSNVLIEGCTIDVGDDCITLKAGIETTRPRCACEDITVKNCRLLHGHGGVVIGSEMSGSVRDVTITDCVFTDTDRGLRIKTRRGRGGVVENVTLRGAEMENVICPFVINQFYGCTVREEQKHLWQLTTPYPVDEGTPRVQNIVFQDVKVKNVQACAVFMYGMPEMPIRDVTMRNCRIEMAENPQESEPAMQYRSIKMAGRGAYLRNVENLQAENVSFVHVRGPEWDRQ